MQENTMSFFEKKYQKKIFIKALSISIFVFGLILAITFTILYTYYQIEIKTHKINAANTIEMQTVTLEQNIQQITSDLIILANQKEFQEIWSSNKAERSQNLSELGSEFLDVSIYRKNYDQIRFLDEHGKEIIRINYNNGEPGIVTQDELQNKKGRYYFDDTLRLKPGEIFVSPLDLNIEHGKIETPLKPMIRFGTPVFDEEGIKKGIVLLNCFGDKMLKRFDRHTSVEKGHQSMLLNGDGYWLQGPYPNDLWGFMYHNRKNKNFKNLYPEAWERIKTKDSCQFLTAQGLYSCKTVYPLLEGQKTSSGSGEAFGSSKSVSEAKSYQWKVVYFIPHKILYQNNRYRMLLATIILSMFALILSLGGWWIAKSSIRRKDAESKLIESKEHLNRIFKSAPTGIGVLHNQAFETVNQKFCEMTGYEENDFSDQKMKMLYLNDEDYHRFEDELSFQILKNGMGVMKALWKKKDGKTIHVSLNITPTDPKDKRKGYTFTALDVTEQTMAKKALQNSHERFLKVLDSIDATIHVSDMATHELLFMNKHMINSIGKDMTGDICYKALHGKSEPCTQCKILQLMDKSQTPDGVVTWQGMNTRTGKSYIYTDRAIEWTDGRIVKLQISTDITKIKKIEEELRQARKMESIGTLAGGIAHDFNNILYMISGNAELALDDLPKSDPAYNNVKEIIKASMRAAGIVKQLLNFSRKTDQNFIAVDAQNVIEDSIKLLRSSLPSTIDIQKDLKCSGAEILADPVQINQILMNICTNAFHAMENKGEAMVEGMLTIKAETIDLDQKGADEFMALKQGAYLKIIIKDTGSGIDPKNISKIFDPYFTTKEIGKGSGMGLSVVLGIVKNHNGAITVDSKLDKGTTFNVLLPLIHKKKQIVVKENDQPLHGSESILLVDDETAIATMEAKMLKKLGYNVSTETNPVEALELFGSKPGSFDLVITDMTMPQMTGVTLSEKLLAIRSDIPVIICTGHGSLINEDIAKEKGLAGYLLKPVTILELTKAMRNILDR